MKTSSQLLIGVSSLVSWNMLLAPDCVGTASAQTQLQITTQRITGPHEPEWMPLHYRLGNDGVSDLVVYSRGEAWHALPSDIWYQRLSGGVPLGAPVQVTSDRITVIRK